MFFPIVAIVVLGLLAAFFSAVQTALVVKEHEVKDIVAIRFFSGISLLLLLIVFFANSTETWIQILFCVLVLFVVELLPIYIAHRNPNIVLKLCPGLIKGISFLCSPFTKHLDKIENSLDMEDLSSALEVVSQQNKETQESKILKGIVRFADIEVSAIMTPRVNMVSVATSAKFNELMQLIREVGYSRMPVYNGNLDRIVGILYVKDILAHLEEQANFEWQKLIRPALFIPETKKIDQLLKEIQERRVHLAIVVDEYGGTTGLITLEDILEEVVGDISDEFDTEEDEDSLYRKLDNNTYLFNAGMPIHDFCRLMNIKDDFFAKYDGEFETLAGFVLEELGRFPAKGETVTAEHFKFTVVSLDRRRIKRIKMTIKDDEIDD